MYFKDYETRGIQVSFENDSGTVHNIYLYHWPGDSPEFAVFCGLVDGGISWQSSVEEVKRAYGQPTAEFSGTYLGVISKRLVFEGIDFRFENERWSELVSQAIRPLSVVRLSRQVGNECQFSMRAVYQQEEQRMGIGSHTHCFRYFVTDFLTIQAAYLVVG